MGKQIIKQPDGRFAIFSSGTDTIHMYDATAEEIVEYFVERAAVDTRREVLRIMEHVEGDEPRRAYFQFTKTWDEALAYDQEHGGEAWQAFAERQPS